MPFDTLTAKQAASKSHAADTRRRYPPSRSQALDIQSALHEAAVLLREDVASCTDKDDRGRMAGALASVAKGWQSITDTLRIQDGVPLPGSLRPEKPAKTKRTSPGAVVLESEPEPIKPSGDGSSEV